MSQTYAVHRLTTRGAQAAAERRAELYKRFLPEWPALAESFAREAKAIADALRGKSS